MDSLKLTLTRGPYAAEKTLTGVSISLENIEQAMEEMIFQVRAADRIKAKGHGHPCRVCGSYILPPDTICYVCGNVA